jgi:hypothetical protein
MSISVVICAYTSDRWDALTAAVESSLDQTFPPDEVVIVVDYNEELYRRAALELSGPQVLVLSNGSTKGLSGARNTGVAMSSGDIVVFLDDDAYAEKDWLEKLVEPMADPMVVGVGGWVLPHWETKAPPWLPETFYWVLGCSYVGLPETNSRLRNPIGANMAMRRRVFTQVGGFTSGIGRIGQVPLGCEETELCSPPPSAGFATHVALLLDPVLGRGPFEGVGLLTRRVPFRSGLGASAHHALVAAGVCAEPPHGAPPSPLGRRPERAHSCRDGLCRRRPSQGPARIARRSARARR